MLPYKFKTRAGRHAPGQSSYDPVLDLKNWSKDSIDSKKGGLTSLALESALQFSQRKPQFLTKFGKERFMPIEEQLFPGVST
jgi:hypothetical protein